MEDCNRFFAVFGSGGGGGNAPSGSGTNNYVARWTPDGNTLGDSLIRDNGSTIGIGTAPNSTGYISITQSTYTYGMIITQNYADVNPHWGFAVQSTASSSGTKVGIRSIVQNGSDLNVGFDTSVDPSATSNGAIGYRASISATTTADVIGASFTVSNAGSGNAYALNLSDGTEADGYILKSDAFGNSSWVDPSTVVNTIYTADDTLAGNRVINQNSLSLSFNNNGGFYIGGTSAIGTENISLQGHTLIQGQGNTSGTTAFEVENIDGNSLLLITDDGHTTIKSKGSSSTDNILSVNNGSGNTFFYVGGDGVFKLGANANNSGNNETNVAINGTTAGTGGLQLAIGTSSTGCFGTGVAQMVIGYNADINSSNNRIFAIGSDVEASNEGGALGNRLSQTALNSFIIGSGTGISTRLTNTVAESLALGFNTTTPSYLFAQTADSYLNGSGNLGIGTTTPDASAKVDITSTTGGFLPPRMTTTQKNAISTPATGLVVFDTTLAKLCVYTGSAWETVISA